MFLLKSDDQRHKTLKYIENLKAQIERVQQKHGPEESRNFEVMANRMIQQFEEQIKTYDRAKQKKLRKDVR